MTIKELTKRLNQEKFDLKGVQVFIRNTAKGECYEASNVVLEDGKAFIETGATVEDVNIIEKDFEHEWGKL